jgi:glucokinase
MRPTAYFGINIGGTRTTVTTSGLEDHPTESKDIPTTDPDTTIQRAIEVIEKWKPGDFPIIGIACGNPLHVKRGTIESPPNLPGWKSVPVVKKVKNALGGQVYLMNDANAGALAEWWFGAGQRCQHMVFLTVGTGFGSGLILNGKLYEGVSGNAGEIGHIRLATEGPTGYRKKGSVEGLCSGGGIAQMARAVALEKDGDVSFNPGKVDDIETVDVAQAAEKGDETAREILAQAGANMGRAVAILIDLLNPEIIVMGSIYERCRPFLEASMREVLSAEVLEDSLDACDIVPAKLGEKLSAQAALSVGFYYQGRLQAD